MRFQHVARNLVVLRHGSVRAEQNGRGLGRQPRSPDRTLQPLNANFGSINHIRHTAPVYRIGRQKSRCKNNRIQIASGGDGAGKSDRR
jgi:hypothetical protein